MKERRPSGEPVLAEVGPPVILSLGVAGYCSVSPLVKIGLHNLETNMEKYELHKIRDGHYIKMIDGNAIGKASKGEVWVYFFSKNNADIDIGVLEVTLALAALFALIVTQPVEIFLRVIAAICFMASYITAAILYGTYVLHRAPRTIEMYFRYLSRNKQNRVDFWLWLVFYYPLLVVSLFLHPATSISGKPDKDKEMSWDQANTEFGYLTLLAALLVGGATVFIYLLTLLIEQL